MVAGGGTVGGAGPAGGVTCVSSEEGSGLTGVLSVGDLPVAVFSTAPTVLIGGGCCGF